MTPDVERRPTGESGAAEAGGPRPSVPRGSDNKPERIEWIANGATVTIGGFPVAGIFLGLCDGTVIRVMGRVDEIGGQLVVEAGARVTIRGRLADDVALHLRRDRADR